MREKNVSTAPQGQPLSLTTDRVHANAPLRALVCQPQKTSFVEPQRKAAPHAQLAGAAQLATAETAGADAAG